MRSNECPLIEELTEVNVVLPEEGYTKSECFFYEEWVPHLRPVNDETKDS